MFEFLGWELGCGYPSNSPEKWLSSLRRLIYWLSGLLFSPHPPKTNKQFIDTLVFLQKHYLSLLHLLLWQKSVTVNPVCVMNFVMNKPVEQFFSFLAVHANVPSSCCVLDKEQVITGSWAFAMAPPMFVSVWREGCFLSVSWLLVHRPPRFIFFLGNTWTKMTLFTCLFLYYSISHVKAPFECRSYLLYQLLYSQSSEQWHMMGL